MARFDRLSEEPPTPNPADDGLRESQGRTWNRHRSIRDYPPARGPAPAGNPRSFTDLSTVGLAQQ